MCQDVNDDKKSPWCIALHTIYTIIAQDDLDRAYLRMELFWWRSYYPDARALMATYQKAEAVVENYNREITE